MNDEAYFKKLLADAQRAEKIFPADAPEKKAPPPTPPGKIRKAWEALMKFLDGLTGFVPLLICMLSLHALILPL